MIISGEPLAAPATGGGQWMHDLAADLFPLRRSITGTGVRQTLARIAEEIPLDVHEVPSGTPVFDWTVPREWNLRDAWIQDRAGRRVVDIADSSLHVMSYSVPIRRRMPLTELKKHVFTLPEQPGLVPYRTSYYAEAWAFCMAHEQLEALPDGDYDVCIDSSLADGHLTYGECFLPGESDDEVLLSCHVCHPALANDNLSGIAVATALARALAGRPRRHGFRFLFVPGTIGAITWLARNERRARKVRHGVVLTCVGDPGPSTYKRSRRGDADVDVAFEHVLSTSDAPFAIQDFTPWGYDERQYCSPGFDLPVGCLMRTPHGRYPEYHTSADNLDLVRPEHLEDTLRKLERAVDVVERNATYVNTNPMCEPQLGKRGLYDSIGGSDPGAARLAMLWVLNQADGSNTLLDIAVRAQMPFAQIADAAELLLEHGLLDRVPPP